MSNQPTNEDDYPDAPFLVTVIFADRSKDESKVLVTDLNCPTSREQFLATWHAFATVAGQAGARHLWDEWHP